ncbi:hypothetical protein LARI1_G003617 [Lachnellula arida]|uniref:Heterokaryon incompatibility domain-containing protein n=1 Tax=Lachnellula arida TaxID=1316785 RepID=A0A8T9BID3_9HELO|nr:hypothetical protein LARI1_G003617 [Lachnellula arida]
MDRIQTPVANFQLGDSGVCTECQKLFESIAKAKSMKVQVTVDYYFRSHYESAMAVQESRRNGCKVCTLFIEAYGFEAFEKDSKAPKEAIGSPGPPNVPQIYLDNQKDRWTIGLRLRDKIEYDQMIIFAPSVDRNSVAPIHEIIRPSTSNYLPIAKHWLKECVEKHEHCVKSDRQVPPTRLLYLGGDRIRLIHTAKSPDIQLQYATLSHAWGSIKFFRLCKENLKDLQDCVPEKELTKTFRDAVYITRSLGLEYLWIDSLCIIQDDEQDWLRESGLMSSVYGGSTINIAAADSLDGNGGCLYDEMATITTRKAFRYRLRMADLQDERPWELVPVYLYPHCTSWSHLASRAWALQERLLAPRTLQFSKTDMLWECHEKDACSLFPDGLPQSLCGHYTYREKASLASIWDLVVELYSAAKLTRYSDKSVALSGLAYAVQCETGDEYVAGMWRKDLEAQLLWSVRPHKWEVPRPRPYRAPTWSWAALDSKIFSADTSTGHLYAHIHSVYTQPIGSSSLGQISGGLLTVSCSVLMRGTTTSKDDLDVEDQEEFESQSNAAALNFGGDTTFAKIS